MVVQRDSEGEEVRPGQDWVRPAAAEVGLEAARLAEAATYAGGAGLVIRGGRVGFAWGDTRAVHHIQSATKSIGVTALGVAMGDGTIRLDDPAVRHHPAFGVPPEENRSTGWLDAITIAQLGQMTAGFGKDGGYTALRFRPGSAWAYSDGGANWLGECVTLAYRCDLARLVWERVLGPLGVRREEFLWRDNLYRPDLLDGVKRREIGAGVYASADALARLGLLYLRRGRWGRGRLLPAAFVDAVRTTASDLEGLAVVNDPLRRFGGASAHYGLLWWTNVDGAVDGVPTDAYWGWGLGDAVVLVIPSLDMVVARLGPPFPGDRSPSYYRALAPFLRAVASACHTDHR